MKKLTQREERLLHTLKHLANCYEAVLEGKMGVNDLTRAALAEAQAEIRIFCETRK